ncbi:hypothetical protein [Clostridium paraputrificum]|uniref:Lichenan-specific phosphotransferase enzyme IIA component n=1 Tax=Clostridium paraputrificum TaxID=29363 RepID=A0A6N3CG26_9CLOT|nr:PTS lactose/cellobiose transporter subunit IIA [Clostridium sp.]MBS5987897.1 PTS lactose/cellobiose transporter subunit IIA [Clostridium sp.]
MNEMNFELILHAGSSKSSIMEAIELARQGEFKEADYKINEAHKELTDAYKIQKKILNKSSKADNININMLSVHAQDQLNSAQIQIGLGEEIINLYEQVQQIKNYLGIQNFESQKYMKVLLVCGQGMSTSLLVQNMYFYANEGDYIESSSFEDITSVIEDYDVILISPQIRYRRPVIERMMNPKKQISGLIDMTAYGKMDGKSIYEQAQRLFHEIKN